MGKNFFFNFWGFLFKMHIFEVVTFFSRVMAARIYKIHVFDETFSVLTIRVSMATKLIRVVTCCRKLPPKNMHNTSMELSCEVT